jgi:hypothetical protein
MPAPANSGNPYEYGHLVIACIKMGEPGFEIVLACIKKFCKSLHREVAIMFSTQSAPRTSTISSSQVLVPNLPQLRLALVIGGIGLLVLVAFVNAYLRHEDW